MKISKLIFHNIVFFTSNIVTIITEKPTQNKMLLMKLRDKGTIINGVDYDDVLDK